MRTMNKKNNSHAQKIQNLLFIFLESQTPQHKSRVPIKVIITTMIKIITKVAEPLNASNKSAES